MKEVYLNLGDRVYRADVEWYGYIVRVHNRDPFFGGPFYGIHWDNERSPEDYTSYDYRDPIIQNLQKVFNRDEIHDSIGYDS